MVPFSWDDDRNAKHFATSDKEENNKPPLIIAGGKMEEKMSVKF